MVKSFTWIEIEIERERKVNEGNKEDHISQVKLA